MTEGIFRSRKGGDKGALPKGKVNRHRLYRAVKPDDDMGSYRRLYFSGGVLMGVPNRPKRVKKDPRSVQRWEQLVRGADKMATFVARAFR